MNYVIHVYSSEIILLTMSVWWQRDNLDLQIVNKLKYKYNSWTRYWWMCQQSMPAWRNVHWLNQSIQLQLLCWIQWNTVWIEWDFYKYILLHFETAWHSQNCHAYTANESKQSRHVISNTWSLLIVQLKATKARYFKKKSTFNPMLERNELKNKRLTRKWK